MNEGAGWIMIGVNLGEVYERRMGEVVGGGEAQRRMYYHDGVKVRVSRLLVL